MAPLFGSSKDENTGPVFEVDDLQIASSRDADEATRQGQGTAGQRRIRLLAIVAIAIVTLYGAALATSIVSWSMKSATARLEQELQRARLLFERTARVDALDLGREAATIAASPVVTALYAREGWERRQAAFQAAEAANTVLARDGRRADLIAILDASGRVIARDLDLGAMAGDDLATAFPSVRGALEGIATTDVWAFTGLSMRAAVAPIRDAAGTVIGAVVVGRVPTAKDAEATRNLIGTEIASYENGRVQVARTITEDRDGSALRLLQAELFGGNETIERTIKTGGAGNLLALTHNGRRYAALATPIPGNYANRTAGVVLMASLSDALRPYHQLVALVVGFGLAALMALVATLIASKPRPDGLRPFLAAHKAPVIAYVILGLAIPIAAPKVVPIIEDLAASGRQAEPPPAPEIYERMSDIVAACADGHLAGRTARLRVSRLARLATSTTGRGQEFPAWVGGCAIAEPMNRQVLTISVPPGREAEIETGFPEAPEAEKVGVSSCRTLELKLGDTCNPLRADFVKLGV